MIARVVCFACEAIKRAAKLSTADRYRIAVRCACGAIEPADLRELRAALNALELQAGKP